jgi:hypothetical protein
MLSDLGFKRRLDAVVAALEAAAEAAAERVAATTRPPTPEEADRAFARLLAAAAGRIERAAEAAAARVLAFVVPPIRPVDLVKEDRFLLQAARRPSGLRWADVARKGLDAERARAFVRHGLLRDDGRAVYATEHGDDAWADVIGLFAGEWGGADGDEW